MKLKTLFYYSVGLVLGFAVLVVANKPDGKTRIIACDVGQGDAILVTRGSYQVLIDGGPSGQKVLACLSRHLPFWDRTIELIVMTHTDFDHINGIASAMERYQVIQFVTADGVENSEELVHLASVIREKHITIRAIEAGETIRVGRQEPMRFAVVWPEGTDPNYVAAIGEKSPSVGSEQSIGASAKQPDTNERSVVLLYIEGSYRALFTGDSGIQTEKLLSEKGIGGAVDYLKVAHHGSKSASSLEWLEELRPKTAVISVGVGNRYGHPAPEIVERLEEVGAKVQRTDSEGDVVTVINQ